MNVIEFVSFNKIEKISEEVKNVLKQKSYPSNRFDKDIINTLKSKTNENVFCNFYVMREFFEENPDSFALCKINTDIPLDSNDKDIIKTVTYYYGFDKKEKLIRKVFSIFTFKIKSDKRVVIDYDSYSKNDLIKVYGIEELSIYDETDYKLLFKNGYKKDF